MYKKEIFFEFFLVSVEFDRVFCFWKINGNEVKKVFGNYEDIFFEFDEILFGEWDIDIYF